MDAAGRAAMGATARQEFLARYDMRRNAAKILDVFTSSSMEAR
jgi:hypothetical protein